MKNSIFILLFVSFTNLFAQSGSFDSTFKQPSSCDTSHIIYDIAKNNDGSLIITGKFSHYDGNVANGVAKLTPDGVFDNSFYMPVNNGENTFAGSKVMVQNDQKILLLIKVNNEYKKFLRLLPNGEVDITFNTPFSNGYPFADEIYDFEIVNNKILVAGSFSNPQNYLIMLNEDGSVYNNFNFSPEIQNQNEIVRKVLKLSTGKFLIYASDNDGGDKRIWRINSNGSIDWSYNWGNPLMQVVHTIKESSDGAIYVAGKGWYLDTSIVKFNSEGEVINHFEANLDDNDDFIRDVLVIDNNLIAGGNFFKIHGYSRKGIVMLDRFDGDINNSFNVGVGFNGVLKVFKIIQQFNDKIIVVGDFSTYNNHNACNITRINYSGNMSTLSALQTANLYIYPNPSSNILHISRPKNDSSQLQIFDSSGKLILTQKLQPNQDLISINISGLPIGTYVCKIGNSISKFIKQ